jgi:dTDP-4-amino-4,6-dideoxygalactose transaminase
MTEFQAAVLTEQYGRFKKQDKTRQENGKYLEEKLTEIPGLKSRKRYCDNTRITYVEFELDYDKECFNNVSASRFAEAVCAEGIPISGGPRRYGKGCHKEGMLQEHLNSHAFQAAFSKARLEKYRESLSHLPVMDNVTPSKKEMLSMDSKIVLLGPRKDVDDIVEAIAKVAKNSDKLA